MSPILEWSLSDDALDIKDDALDLRWHGSHSAEVNENINLGYSHDQGYS